MVGQTVLTDTGVFMDRDRDGINANFQNAFPALPIVETGDFGIPANVNGSYIFTKGSAAALTLAAPPIGVNGIVILLTSGSAFAHVLTATNLLNTGGTAVSVLTAAAHAGASVLLMSYNGLWNVISNNHWTETS